MRSVIKAFRRCAGSRVPIFVVLVMGVLTDCAGVKNTTESPEVSGEGLLVMVYGRGPSWPDDDADDVAESRMTVHVTQSDSTFEFGHVTRDGKFHFYLSGPEGSFRIRGGEVRRFAIKKPGSAGSGYSLRKFSACELSGPAMKPDWAITPRLDEPYFSIAVLSFAVSKADTVVVELVASAPNGFALAD